VREGGREEGRKEGYGLRTPAVSEVKKGEYAVAYLSRLAPVSSRIV